MHEAVDKRTDLLGRIDTARLMPAFLERLNAVLNACAARGQLYVATSGLRTYEEQDALYAKGKLVDGKWKGPTKARGGQSIHNFGLAVDFAPHRHPEYTGTLDPDYRTMRYVPLGEECKRAGLEWGGGWRGFVDMPHVQFPIPKTVRLRDLDLWFRTSGIEKTWDMLLSRQGG